MLNSSARVHMKAYGLYLHLKQALAPILEQTSVPCVLILSVEKNYPKMLSFPVVLCGDPAKELEEVVFWIKWKFGHF